MEQLKGAHWMSTVFEKLFVMQCNAVLCDVVIECQEKEKLPVHSCVLAAASPFFNQELTDHNLSSRQQKVIDGKAFSKETWINLIQFIYHGYLDTCLDACVVDSLRDIADKLSISALEETLQVLEICSVKDEIIAEHDDDNSASEMIVSQDSGHDTKEETTPEEDSFQSCITESDSFLKQKKSSKPSKCRKCSLTFTSFSLLQEHNKNEHEKYKCLQCDKGFEKERNLMMHQKFRHQEKQEYKCKICDFLTDDRPKYLLHCKTHKDHKCTHCPHQAKSKAKLMWHLKEVHALKKLFRCSFSRCSYSANSSFTIKMHEATVHVTERSFRCDECPKQFKTQMDLNRHSLIHNHKYACEECESGFARKCSLEDHKRKKHGADPLKCEQCDALFDTVNSQRKHVREIHEGRFTKYKKCACKLCDKVVKNMGELRRHMRVHTGEKLFPCKSCSRSFASKYDLQNHEMIHSGEKPFLCSYCSYQCNRQYNLNVHERRHKEEHQKTPVMCSQCKPAVSFRCQNDFEKHQLQEHDNINTTEDSTEDNDKATITSEVYLDKTSNQHYRILTVAGENGAADQQLLFPVDLDSGENEAFNVNMLNNTTLLELPTGDGGETPATENNCEISVGDLVAFGRQDMVNVQEGDAASPKGKHEFLIDDQPMEFLVQSDEAITYRDFTIDPSQRTLNAQGETEETVLGQELFIEHGNFAVNPATNGTVRVQGQLSAEETNIEHGNFTVDPYHRTVRIQGQLSADKTVIGQENFIEHGNITVDPFHRTIRIQGEVLGELSAEETTIGQENIILAPSQEFTQHTTQYTDETAFAERNHSVDGAILTQGDFNVDPSVVQNYVVNPIAGMDVSGEGSISGPTEETVLAEGSYTVDDPNEETFTLQGNSGEGSFVMLNDNSHIAYIDEHGDTVILPIEQALHQ